MFKRDPLIPIISSKDILSDHPEMIDVSSVFNPGAIKFDNKILLLLRVQNRARETLLVKALSDDGIHFNIDSNPLIINDLDQADETIFHIYDPRITKINQSYYILAAIDVHGKCLLGLLQTTDFRSLNFIGFTGKDDNRNGVLFPEKVQGKFARYDRPNKVQLEGGVFSGDQIWYSESDDLIHWTPKKMVMDGRLHYWDENIGAGPPPIKTREGWLLIYHGIAMHYQPIYQVGAALLDLDEPWRVISRGRYNILEPREIWETTGQVPNVVFPSGIIADDIDPEGFAILDSEVTLYYGAADTHIGRATSTIKELIHACYC